MKAIIFMCFIFLSIQINAQLEQEINIDSTNFENIKVMPNPTSEILFIRNGDRISSYQLYDSQGNLKQESKNNPQVISLIDEPIGNYFLILEIAGTFKSYRVAKY